MEVGNQSWAEYTWSSLSKTKFGHDEAVSSFLMANVIVNGVTIEYEVCGTGEPMLFVMGLGGQLTEWPDDFVQLFVDRGFQVIRFDNRDIGLSTQTDWEPPSRGKIIRSLITRRPLKDVGYTVRDMADDAAGLLDSLGISSCHVMGVSMGGMISQELAICHPAKVRSLCSIMSNTGDRKNGGIARTLIAKFARQQPATRENAVEVAVDTFAAISGPHFDADEYRLVAESAVARSFAPAGMARQTAAIAGSRDRTALLGSISVPTLVVHGLIDQLVQPSGGIATTKAIPAARLLAFADMAHDLPRTRWHEMCDEIIRNAERAAAEPVS
ncbi:MAG: pimeloyl-ACP methyl ester carboxylesterase [Thermoproteota archaeon]